MLTLKGFREYLRISGAGGISRRYFVINSFDGAMTMLGIIVGAKLGGTIDPKFIIGAGAGVGLAMGISGLSGAYMTERAERLRGMRRLRRAMLSDLRRSIHARASTVATLWAAVIDAVSPAIAIAVSMSPYILADFNVIPTWASLPGSLGIIFALLFSLGAFLGKVSKENVMFAGLRMLAAGAATAFILWMLGGFGI
jgi:predicted membrane protein (TIGR00267 family)